MVTLFRTQPFLDTLADCPNESLKVRVEERLKSLETIPSDKLPLSNSLQQYASKIIIMKFFGDLNSRVILQKEKVKDATIYFIRMFIEPSRYDYWRREIESDIPLWIRKHPLSREELKAGLADHQKKITYHKTLFYQQKNRQTVPEYMQQWFEQDWFKQVQYRSQAY